MNTEVIEHGTHGLEITEADEKRALVVMDRIDLQQALAELRGEVVASFVYIAKGKRQLSYAGIKEAARLYRNVDFGATATPLQDGSWMITSYAHNLADNLRVSLPMPYPAFNPGSPTESIEYRANLSKSVRNALAAVIPVAYLQEMIKRWLEEQEGGRHPLPQEPRHAPQAPPRQLAATAAPEMPQPGDLRALRAVVEEALALDAEARAKVPKPMAELTEAELSTTLAWLNRRIRTELADWFAQYPDALLKAEQALAAKGKGPWRDSYSAAAMRKAVVALRERAAVEEALKQSQQAAAGDGLDLDVAQRLAGAIEIARRTVLEVIARPRSQPTKGDLQAIRILLREIQATGPLPSDTPEAGLEEGELVAELEKRVDLANKAQRAAAAAQADDADETPF